MSVGAVCRFIYRFGQIDTSYIARERKKSQSVIHSFVSSLTSYYKINMTDTRTLSSSSSSTTNHVNGTNTTSPLPADLNNVSGLTTYVSFFICILLFSDYFYLG
jgi:hypothetical protein